MFSIAFGKADSLLAKDFWAKAPERSSGAMAILSVVLVIACVLEGKISLVL